MSAGRARRLARLESAVSRLPQPGQVPAALRAYLASLTDDQLEAVEIACELASHAERPGFDLERHLTFGELLAADEIATKFPSPAAALAARDPTMVALFGAAAARFAGVEVAELFPEPETSTYRPVS